MSVFASTALTGAALNIAQLISEINNKLPCRLGGSFASSSLVSTAVSNLSPASLMSVSVTLEIDDIALFVSMATVSCGTVGDRLVLNHTIGAVLVNNFAVYSDGISSANGNRGTLIQFSTAQDLAGATTFDVTIGREGSGTVYAVQRNLSVLLFKRRA